MLKGKFGRFKDLYFNYKCVAVSSVVKKIDDHYYCIVDDVLLEDTLIVELFRNTDLKLLYKSEEFKKQFYERCKHYKLL